MRNGKELDEEGNIYYYKNGKLHREDGPAIEYEDGDCYWFKDGMLHREDGPAVIYEDGDKWYYINDEMLSEQKFVEWKLQNFLK